MIKVWRISCAVPMALLLGLCISCAGSQDTVETEKISEITSTETAVQTEDMADGTIAPDLNGNGIPEQVILKEMEDGQGQELEIWENGTCIDCETGYVAHTDRKSVV